MQVEIGKIYEGKVTGITKFGAFVEIEQGVTGMVHISEVANTYVNEIKDHVTEGQVVKVKVISIGDDNKISLSIKKALPPVQKPQQGGNRQNKAMRCPIVITNRQYSRKGHKACHYQKHSTKQACH